MLFKICKVKLRSNYSIFFVKHFRTTIGEKEYNSSDYAACRKMCDARQWPDLPGTANPFLALAQASGRRHRGDDEVDGIQRDQGADGGGSSLNIGLQCSLAPAASLGTSLLDGPQEKEGEPERAMSSKLQNFPAHQYMCAATQLVYLSLATP